MKLHFSLALPTTMFLVVMGHQSGLAFSIVPSQPGATFDYQPVPHNRETSSKLHRNLFNFTQTLSKSCARSLRLTAQDES
ncbi:MAG: hypothetical protein SAK42_19395 [Oscillatoria sp. PMC 1076.18]|nr:hypothetical protein [Oscillatoria sp. PMC 1076.18]